MRHGSLFSGVGGFDLAAQWMGWENMFHCEWNQFGQKVLKYYWPNAISYDDICKTDFTIWNGRIDILTGGFPCQPYSMAGKRQGTEDSRHLWPEMLRAIRECRPTWIVGENVPGLINWSGGLVFEQVCADLEGEGYEVQPVVLPASGVNAPHRRDRVWFVARRNVANSASGSERSPGQSGRINSEWSGNFDEQKERGVKAELNTGRCDILPSKGIATNTRLQRQEIGQIDTVGVEQLCEERDDANTTTIGMERSGTIGEQISRTHGGESLPVRNSAKTDWTDWPTVAPLRDGNDGLSSKLDGITFPKWRNESIKAGGNAIVPQVAYQIFKVIEQMQNT